LTSNANRDFAHHTHPNLFFGLVLGHYLRKPFTIKEHGVRETNVVCLEAVTKVAEKGRLDCGPGLPFSEGSAAHWET
jgi:hypothetical protein